MNQFEQIMIDNEKNNNISNGDFFHLEDNNINNINNIHTEPLSNFHKIYQDQQKIYPSSIQKVYKKDQVNFPHYITQSLAKKIIQNNNTNLNITSVNQDMTLNNTCPNRNKLINNDNSNNFINRSSNTIGINNLININDDINREYESLTDDNEKLKELAKNIKENGNKIEQMNKTMNKILVLNNKSDDLNDENSIFSQMNDIEKIKQENITLKADSIIYREDINHLMELNNKYTIELELSRRKILDLISRNNDIEKDINHKDYQINKLNEVLSRLRLYENPDMEYKISNNKSKEQIIHELEFNIKILEEENNKLNSEKNILKDKIKDIIESKSELNNNIASNNEQNNKMINNMNEKILMLEKEINELSNENNLLNIDAQRNEKEMERLCIEKNSMEDKYNKKKEEYQKLENDFNILNKRFQQLIYENNRSLMDDESKKSDNNEKTKKMNKNAINELYNKIQILKSKTYHERDFEN